MQGHFDLRLMETPKLTREVIDAVRREGGDPAVEEYLRRFPVDGEWKTKNMIFQPSPAFLFYRAMSGPSVPNSMTGNGGILLAIVLSPEAAEPVYTDYAWVISPHTNAVYSVTTDGTSYKYFIDNCIVTPDIKSDPHGRESIYIKCKWLYLPGEATSDQIKSIGVWGSGGWSIAAYCGRTGRVRIKDSGGNPVTIAKAATKSFLVEYTFTMPSL